MLGISAALREIVSRPKPEFINGNVGTNSASATSITWSHTTTPDTTCLFVSAWVNNNGGSVTISGVTFAGIAMTQVQQGAAGNPEGCYVLFNPPIGTFSIVVTPSVLADRGIGASSANFRNAKSVAVSGHVAQTASSPLALSILNNHPLPGVCVFSVAPSIGGGAALPAPVVTMPPYRIQTAQYQDFVSNANHKGQGIYYSDFPAIRQGTLAGSVASTGATTTYSMVVLVNA